MNLFWISFADSELPEGQQFLGCVVVRGATDIVNACKVAHALGINPGGEALGYVRSEGLDRRLVHRLPGGRPPSRSDAGGRHPHRYVVSSE